MGCGVRTERICVTIAPSIPPVTMVSPSFNWPFTKITSMVVPRPGSAFT